MFWTRKNKVLPVNKDILKKTKIRIESEGELVVVNIGNSVFKLHYEDALLLSQWLRVRAKDAKRVAGDNSRHWSVIGTLHDANYGPDVTRG